jgi:hypothetical protein
VSTVALRAARACGIVAALLRALLRERAGGMAVLLALGAPVVVGAAGVGIETGLWYMTHRQAQTAADSAAVAGAIELIRGQPALMRESALADAARNGFANGGADAIAVNHPPASGSRRGDAGSVEAVVSRRASLFFSSFFLRTPPTIEARAVAGVQGNGNACILALDARASGAVTNSGTTTVTSRNCVIAANSRSNTAILAGGNSTLIAEAIWTAGGYGQSGNATLTLTDTPHTAMWALADPFSPRRRRPILRVSQTTPAGREPECRDPGARRYCSGGIVIGALAVVTLQPGTYYARRGFQRAAAPACAVTAGRRSGVTIVPRWAPRRRSSLAQRSCRRRRTC